MGTPTLALVPEAMRQFVDLEPGRGAEVATGSLHLLLLSRVVQVAARSMVHVVWLWVTRADVRAW